MEKVFNGIWKLRWGQPEENSPFALSEVAPLEDALENLGSAGIPPISTNDIQIKETAKGLKIELPLRADEQIYGFGLQLHRMNHTGRKKVIRVNSDPVADTGDSHAPVPFYVSTAGYGVYVDTARYATFYCGTNLSKGTSKNQKNQQKAVGTSEIELYGYQKAEGDRSVVVDIPFAKGIDLYFFEGPELKSAVQRYNLFSGGGTIPPAWGLGVWYRAYSAAKNEDVMRLADNFRQDNMPIDVFGFEPGWQSRAYSCSFVWDDNRFPNHEEMLEQLYQMNYRVNLWEHVFVHPSSPMYEEVLPYSGDYEVWEGLVPDFALKEARNIFAEHHLRYFIEKGISGFKLDECDSSDFVHSNWSFPDIAEFPSGLDGEQMHNMLGVLYQSTLLSAFKTVNKRTLSQVRSSGALAASYPFVLYSDLYDHRVFIRGVVNSGFSGLLWSPEVRHASSPEDLIRRIETVVFSPHALLNCWRIPNPPWMQVDQEKNKRGEFFTDFERIRDLCQSLFQTRMSLIPYLYASFAKYKYEGIPPFRALVMDYPHHPNTYEIDDAYMMGDSLLVAPIVTGETERHVYLPDGRWWDFWTDTPFEGGQSYLVKPELGKIPVFIKDDSILPIADPLQNVKDDSIFDMTVKVYGENPKDFFLFEDDGTSFNYEEGKFNWVRLSWSKEYKGVVERKGDYLGRRYQIKNWERK
ncbi:TIM-barrel domain-containing protein [Neobacillus vireti]|uniref:glycoside hydrolase family 31 protein n=1 Tax=Neobacillus vireti TaxID=220686 RepID=UPI002FFFD5E6